MRPISLKLAGLQSYREPQEIDFTRLCDAGVFGIFGPTGSGKSSLLDAITLALYCKVERASLGTQGIMNQFENALMVAFTFELSSSAGTERYRVERQFKRTGDVTIGHAISRFVHMLPEGDQVVADKQQDVTNCVEELIGLTMQDFTRAVVLPQGKFAEFLSLKDSDRRKMLQRLFHLEAYGDALTARISSQAKETDYQVKQLTAEQSGLGNASEAALAEAKQSVLLLTEAARIRRESLLALEKQVRQLQIVRQRQSEAKQIQNALIQLTASESIITEHELQVALSERAERIYPFYQAYAQAEADLSAKLKRLEQIERQEAEIRLAFTQSKISSDEAQQQWAAQEGPLQVRLAELKQAKVLESEIDVLIKDAESVTQKLQALSNERSEASERLVKEQTKLVKAMNRQTELKEELKRFEVRNEDRLQIHNAIQRKRELELLAQQVQDNRESCSKNTTTLNQLQHTLLHFQDRQAQYGVQWQTLSIQLFDEHQAVLQANEKLQQVLNAIPITMEQERLKGEAQALHETAAQLAQHLHEDQPCPVCGSVEHPFPAKQAASAQLTVPSALSELQQLLDHARSLVPELKQLHRGYEGMASQLSELSFLDTKYSEAATALELLPYTPEISLQTAEELTDSLKFIAAFVHNADGKMTQISVLMKKELQQLNLLHSQLQAHTAEMKAISQIAAQADQKLKAAELALAEAHMSFKAAYPTLELGKLDQLHADLAEKDGQAQKIRDGLQISGPFIETVSDQVRTLEQHSAAMELERVQLATLQEGKQELLKEKRQRLLQWTGSQSVDKLMDLTNASLEQLKLAVQKGNAALELASQQLQQASHDLSSAKQAAESSKDYHAKATYLWQEAIEKSSFDNDEQLQAALLEAPMKERWIEEIKQHRERQKTLTGQLEHIQAQLQGNAVTDTEWEEAEQALASAKAEDELSVQAKARAERDVEDVQERHTKWMELEQQATQLKIHLTRLTKLQTVFRGNAFIDFIASEQLLQVSRAASERLGFLTRQRYALEVDSSGGFIIRDDANGGSKRPASTLSGGETFLTSLALALALSAQIQLKGQYPLEFFFLDEGFGTLDQDLLDMVITSLEKLHTDRLSVGVISHVPELRARLARRLIVTPAEPSGRGSRISIETL